MNIIKSLVAMCAISIVGQSVLAKTISLPAVDISRITVNGKNIKETLIDGVDINATCSVTTGFFNKLNPMGNKTKPCNFNVQNSTANIWFDGHTLKGFKIPALNLSYDDRKDVDLCVRVVFLKNTNPSPDSGVYPSNTIFTIRFCNNVTPEEIKENAGFLFPLDYYQFVLQEGIFTIP